MLVVVASIDTVPFVIHIFSAKLYIIVRSVPTKGYHAAREPEPEEGPDTPKSGLTPFISDAMTVCHPFSMHSYSWLLYPCLVVGGKREEDPRLTREQQSVVVCLIQP